MSVITNAGHFARPNSDAVAVGSVALEPYLRHHEGDVQLALLAMPGHDRRRERSSLGRAHAQTPQLTDDQWQKSVTDEQIKKTIIYGGAAVDKSPIMPANADLEAKPEVVEGLVKIVRSFGS